MGVGALGNIFTERLWRAVKYEEVYLHDFENPREARRGLTQYLDFYNHQRVHQSLNYATPAEVYFRSVQKGASATLPAATRACEFSTRRLVSALG